MFLAGLGPGLVLVVPLMLTALFARTLRESLRCDLVHANWAICGAVAGLAGLLTRKPVVTTLRGDDVNSTRRSLVSRIFLRLSIRLSRAVVTVSDDLRLSLISDYGVPEVRVHTIPNGVGDAFLAQGEQRSANPSGDRLRLITVGSLIPRKNLGFLLRALAKLPPTVDLSLVGSGEELSTLQNLARDLGIADRVAFLGKRDPAEIPGLLARHDLFVLPSLSEGRSNAVYEAMAAGLAVLASDIPGTREQIDDGTTGFLFPLERDSELVELLARLNSDRALLQATGAAAHRWIVENGYTWTAARDRYLDLFRLQLEKGS